jgi:hypothetical protein
MPLSAIALETQSGPQELFLLFPHAVFRFWIHKDPQRFAFLDPDPNQQQ